MVARSIPPAAAGRNESGWRFRLMAGCSHPPDTAAHGAGCVKATGRSICGELRPPPATSGGYVPLLLGIACDVTTRDRE